MDAPLKSYTSTRTGLLARVKEMLHLYRWQGDKIAAQNQVMIQRLQEAEQAVYACTGVRVENLRALEIGPGQKMRQMAYFSRRNSVVGIDLDAIAQGFDIAGYWRMFRQNGLTRVLKTVGRKVMGLDRAFNADLAAQLGMPGLPEFEIQTMDASKMSFPDNSFDFVYSFSVFEHLPNPGAVMDEVVRVLKPGGAAYISLHLWTSDDGCHDPRCFSGNRGDLPNWAHLRPQHAHKVRPNAYLNKLRLIDWAKIFRRHMPGVTFRRLDYDHEAGRKAVAALRRVGELKEYSDEELLTVDLAAIWGKPAKVLPAAPVQAAPKVTLRKRRRQPV